MTREEVDRIVEEDEGFSKVEEDDYVQIGNGDIAYVSAISVNLVIVIFNITTKKAIVGNFVDIESIDFDEMFTDLLSNEKCGDNAELKVWLLGHSADILEDANEDEIESYWSDLAHVLHELVRHRIDFTKIEWVKPDKGEHLSVYVDMSPGMVAFYQSEIGLMRAWAFWDEYCGPVTEDEQIDAGVSDSPDEE